MQKTPPSNAQLRQEYAKLREFERPWNQRFNAIFNEILTDESKKILCKELRLRCGGLEGYQPPNIETCKFEMFVPSFLYFQKVPEITENKPGERE